MFPALVWTILWHLRRWNLPSCLLSDVFTLNKNSPVLSLRGQMLVFPDQHWSLSISNQTSTDHCPDRTDGLLILEFSSLPGDWLSFDHGSCFRSQLRFSDRDPSTTNWIFFCVIFIVNVIDEQFDFMFVLEENVFHKTTSFVLTLKWINAYQYLGIERSE